MFRFEDGSILMLHEGTWLELPGSSIIEKWPYGSELLTPVEIASRMELGGTMPSINSLAGYPFNNHLMYPLSHHMFEFSYNPLPAIERTLKRSGCNRR